MKPTVSWEQALAWRVRRQLLDDPMPDVVGVARRLGGVQAQVAASAEHAVWLRSGVDPAATREALWSHRSLVKAWAMRGTLHWLPADEYPTWVAALRDKERNLARGAAWERYHGLTKEQLARVTNAVGEIVGDEPLTREELAVGVGERLGDESIAGAIRTSFGGSVLKTAAAEGHLCFGPNRDRNVTFVAPGAWLGTWDEPDVDVARAAVVSRFFATHAPATADDLARWWGVPAAQGKRMLRAADVDLTEVDLDGRTALVPADAVEELTATEPLDDHVRLLPGFDPYVLAPRSHRRGSWPAERGDRISRPAGWISPTVVVDGRVVAVWRAVRSAAGTTVSLEALGRLSKRTRARIAEAAAAYEPTAAEPAAVEWVDRIEFGKGSGSTDG